MEFLDGLQKSFSSLGPLPVGWLGYCQFASLAYIPPDFLGLPKDPPKQNPENEEWDPGFELRELTSPEKERQAGSNWTRKHQVEMQRILLKAGRHKDELCCSSWKFTQGLFHTFIKPRLLLPWMPPLSSLVDGRLCMFQKSASSFSLPPTPTSF